MATLTLTFPNGKKTKNENGFAKSNNYDDRKLEGESKGQFFKRMTREWINQHVVTGNRQIDTLAATSGVTDFDPEIT